MHVAGLSLDLYWFVQFVFTALLVAFGFFHLVKSTASRYLVVDTNFDQGGGGVDLEDDRRADSEEMLAAAGDGDSCAFCGNSAKKICSGCKAVRYCSQACQMQHWKSNHKAVCKEFKLSGNVNLTPSVKNAYGRTGYRGESSIAASSFPGHGNSMFQQSKVLFPYDEFVKLFNWDKPGFPPCGLLNCGNSCFANVVLQCLACTRPLVAYLLEKGHRRECRRNDWCFFCELQVHVERARQSLQPFSPINILSRLPNIGGNLGCGKQEDAHEFMRFAIDTMQSICLDEFGGEKFLHPSSQETSLIQHIFGGYLQSQVICTKCNKISNRYENMMDLTVEIQGDATSLQDCLNQFTDRERLDGENMYKCDGCNDYVKAWKRLTIHQAPNILTIALKRFQSGRFGKLNKKVSFPENLDLGPYMSEAGDGTDLYRLYAVVVHLDMLNASFFGHYICYTKDFSGNWYRIDDCKVMTVELEEVLAQGAYMLLYSRKHVRPPSVKPLESSRKEGQLVGEAQELQPCSQQPVESFIVAGCLPDDVSLSKESVPEISRVSEDPKSTIECPLDVDLCNPVSSPAGSGNPVCISGGLKESVPEREISSRVNGDPKSATEVLHDMDLCNPESFSSDSKDLVCCSTKCSQAVEVASPVELVHKGFPDLASSSETFSTEARSLECEFSSRITEVESSFQDGNGASSNYGKGLSLESSKGSLSSQENVHEMAVVSLEVPGAALSSVAETLDETNRASSEILSNSSLEPVITVKSGKISPAPCTTETRSSKLAADNSHCRGNLKPLFSPGFLNKSTRNRSLNGHGKSPREPCEVGSSSEVDSNCNGFSKSDFLHCNSGEINDDSGSLVTSTSVEEWQPEKCLNEDEKVNKAGELGNSCNDKCIGDTVSVLSDKNGSNDCNHYTGQSFLCANGKDQLVGYSVPIQSPIDNSCSRGKKLLFSPGFLDNKRKRSLHRDGKAQMESGDVGPSGTVDINCNGIADPGLTVQHSGEVNDHCGVRDSYRILTSNPIEKQSKNCLNKDEMTNKELGEVGNTSSINCTGVNVSVLCDENCENIYNCDAGHKTIFENDRCQLTDYGMPLRSTYNDKLLGKKSSDRNGEGQELSETVHHPKVETNCKRLADGRPPPMKQLLDKTKICPKEIWSVCQTSEPNDDCNQQFNTGLACEGGQNCKRQRHI